MTKKQFQSLPFHKKAAYVVKKYAWEAIFAGYLFCLLGSWIYLDYVEPQPVLSVEMIDGSLAAPNAEAFEGFMDAEGLVCTDESVKVSKMIQLGNEPGEISLNPNALLFCKANEGKTDLYFWDDDMVEASLSQFDLLDLRKVLTPEILLKLEDRLVYSAPLLRDGFPCGIRLDDCEWIQKNGFYENCVVGISKNVQDPELVRAFLEYIS